MAGTKTALTRDAFEAACEAEDRTRSYLRRSGERSDLYLAGVYRMFARWIEGGEQPGPHLRGGPAEGEASTGFRGPHNWRYRPELSGPALEAAVAEARRIAGMRGAGRDESGGLPDVYKPLHTALKVLSTPPVDLHAGGPRAKVLSGEQQVAKALCLHCMERMRPTARADEKELLARLDELRGQGAIKYEVLYPAANAKPYGTPKETQAVEDAESAAVQTTRGVLGCNYGSQSCLPYVTKALVRTLRDIEASEGAEAAAAFAVELDELILREEFAAAVTAKTKAPAPAFERVLWRGADAKGYPAWWLVRLEAGRYAMLGKFGRRWALQAADWDSALALVPDEHFEAAVTVACARDGRE